MLLYVHGTVVHYLAGQEIVDWYSIGAIQVYHEGSL